MKKKKIVFCLWEGPRAILHTKYPNKFNNFVQVNNHFLRNGGNVPSWEMFLKRSFLLLNKGTFLNWRINNFLSFKRGVKVGTGRQVVAGRKVFKD